MSIFGDMFEDEADRPTKNAGQGGRSGGSLDLKIPPSPRLSSGLCGIYNQGATCYLNSLLQTLIMTPEFRESLFHLPEEELGRLEDKDKPGSKVRVIPLHLKKLFAQVLLSNQQGVSTSQLTDSFGWTNSEELQQHDVQELNRILFSAVEDSLVGTSGQHLIKDLYHGAIVNQIICQTCGRVSEREEDFLDLCLAVAGHGGLEEALESSYVFMELMEGSNQYRCDNCNRLVNAEKGARIRHLPSILTISLLRFSFDFEKLERYKETGKFTFPTTLDMGRYCEENSVTGPTDYELYSVVIHRGSTHGGHYHAYIRDVDGLGAWTHPDEEEIQLPTDPSTGKVDFIEFDSPIELLQAIMAQHGQAGVPVDRLCAELVKQTGVSWNKRFKKQHGPINKFLKKYDDKFEFDSATSLIRLKSYTPPVKDVPNSAEPVGEPQQERKPAKRAVDHLPPEPGHAWFDFDDSRIRPITVQQLEKQFSGKESAYMLFYRKRTMTRPKEAFGDPVYAVPEDLISQVLEDNIQLDKERAEYETKINTIDLEIHFGTSYDYVMGALRPVPETTVSLTVSFDRRKTVGELRTLVTEVGGVLVPQGNVVIHHAKELPAGLHLYDCLTDDLNQTVMQTALADKSKIFAWDGKLVCGKMFPIGPEMEPVLLNITYGNPSRLSYGFPKTLKVIELAQLISDSSNISMENLVLSRVITKGSESALLTLLAEDSERTLADLQVVDGDHFIAENKAVTGGALAESTMALQSLVISLMVENRCIDPTQDWPVFVVEIRKDSSVAELKVLILAQMNISDVQDGGRLRLDDENHGLSPPILENQSVELAGLRQGMKVIVEPGAAPTGTQLTVYVTHHDRTTKWSDLELIVEKDMTIGAFLQRVLAESGLEGDEWHLRKTNWCGEAAQVLDDLDASLASYRVDTGNQLLLVIGRLPPHGYIQLPIWLLGTQPVSPPGEQDESLLAWITHSIQGLLGGGSGAGDATGGKDLRPGGPASLGELLVSKETTLEELKLQVMTLPQMIEVPVPSPNHLRLRLLEQKKPTTVLRGSTNTIQRLKLTSSSDIGVQILPHEEDLNLNQILLSVQLAVPGQRAYQSPSDLVWDLTRAGAAPPGLRQAISEMLGLPCEQLTMAKYFPEKYEWMVIKSSNVKSHKGKKKGQGKVNLRHAPFHLKDGDVIGVKHLAADKENQDDFATEEDIKGQERLQQEAEERRKKREENRGRDDILNVGATRDRSGNKRREVGIKIHVADFR